METTPQREFCPWTDRLPEEAFQKLSPAFSTKSNMPSELTFPIQKVRLSPEKRAYIRQLLDKEKQSLYTASIRQREAEIGRLRQEAAAQKRIEDRQALEEQAREVEYQIKLMIQDEEGTVEKRYRDNPGAEHSRILMPTFAAQPKPTT